MPLTSGARLGPYEIVGLIGAGGMGEVYRARDTKLNREIALKVLPASFATDAGRLARFRREAQMLAALNHPNIASIYGFDDSGATHALVMEFVEGQTLDEILFSSKAQTSSAKGQTDSTGPRKPGSNGETVHAAPALKPNGLPLAEVLAAARQIADALEFAHERGIIHRDLKPANIKIREDGTIKVLDFGLAKALAPEVMAPSADALSSPTLTGHTTQMGVIMGTAAYMSPEQAKGKNVDRRADIWAFGVVLYEMLTGRRGYEGEDVSDTLAAVLTRDVNWAVLPADAPARLLSLLRDCLQRDPKMRLRDIGEARRVLNQLIDGRSDPDVAASSTNLAASARVSRLRSVLPWTIAAAGLLAAAWLGILAWHLATARQPELRLQIVTPSSPLGWTSVAVALSPDGRQISGTSDSGPIWVRPLDSEAARTLPGTEQSGDTFWSPDSKSIGFVANQKLKRIELATGVVQTLADAPTYRGATWNENGTILFAPGGNGPLYRIPSTGGQPVPVTRLQASQASHRWPQFLPGGHQFLFWVIGPPDVQGEYVGSLDNQEYQRICVADGPATFVPPRHIFFVRDSVLYAQQFDLDHMKLKGEPTAVASGVSSDRVHRTAITASDTGIIAFRPDLSVKRQVTWLDRTGKTLGTIGEPLADMRWGDLSPDGHTLAITTQPGEVGPPDIFLMDMARGTLTRLTTETSGVARWSPDGTRIAFEAGRSGILDLYVKVVGSSGPDALLLASKEALNLSDWSPDGKYILYSSQNPATARDIWAVAIGGADRKSFPVVQTPAEERNGRFSPDGRWVAYNSNEAGSDDVFVRPFLRPGPALRISMGGGIRPFWRHDGKELYYIADDQLMAVPIQESAKGSLDIGMPKSLFKTHGVMVPESDGRRFLLLIPQGDVSPRAITVIVNWAGQDK